jgi:hypothetical protein
MLWFHCDDNTGAIVTAGMSPTLEMAQAQLAGEGLSLFVVPDGTVANVFSPEPDFSVLRGLLCQKIDGQAGDLRMRFITDVPGQAQTYEKKEREARTWTAGDETAHPELYPFMIAEAQARGIAIAEVRAQILQQVEALTPIAARIEALRVASKEAIAAATVLPHILAAAQVDWQAAVAPAA